MFTRCMGPGVRCGLLAARGLLAAALAATLSILMPAPAAARQSSASERAAQLNEEGKRLWLEDKDLAAAVDKFRQATVLSPEGRYYFNLCYALHQLGRYREALTACEAVEPNGADSKVLQKTRTVLEDLRQRVPAEPRPDPDPGTTSDPAVDPGTDPGPGGYPDPNTGDPRNPDAPGPTGDPGYPDPRYQAPANGPPPGPLPGLQQQSEPTDAYNWSLGAALGLVGSSIGDADLYGRGGATLKLHADFMWLSSLKLGVQGYVNLTQIGAETMTGGVQDSLEIVDFGGALYKHIPLRQVQITPLVGVQLSGLQPSDTFAEPVVKAGLRLEAGVSWLLGTSRTHVISLVPALTLYSATADDQASAAFYGLDGSGTTMAVTLGYTMRFKTPFGSMPFITLE